MVKNVDRPIPSAANSNKKNQRDFRFCRMSRPATFSQDAYIWGERKKWWCFSTHDDDLLHSDHKLKIIAPDETFFWFTYILKGKQRIKMQITEMGKEQSNGNDSDRLTSLKRRLRDLEGLEKNLFSGSMSLY